MAARINPIKVKQEADKAEKANRIDQAIALYRQIVDDNPRDWNTINKIGDLYSRLSKAQEASVEYAKVADFYAKDGFLLKAIAIWKKIQKLDQTALDPYLNLADLYAKQGLMMEAKGQYQIVVDEYIKRGKVREAGEILKKMVDIDPADLKIRSKLPDLYLREGNLAKAVEEHVAIADELNKKGHLAEALQVLEKGLKIDARNARLRTELARIHLLQKNWDKAAHFLEEAVQLSPNDTQILARLGEAYVGGRKMEEAEAIFKRLLELDPRDDENRLQMGRVYLLQQRFDEAYEQYVQVADRLIDRRDPDKAASLLQQILNRSATHVKTLLKMVDIYRATQKEAAVAATYSQLADAYLHHGQLEHAASVMETLVQREPQNQQHRTKLDFVRGKLAARAAAPAPPPPVAAPVPLPAAAPAEVVEEEFAVGFEEEFGGAEAPAAAPLTPPPVAAAAPAGRPAIELSGPPSDEEREFVDEHLAEGKVFRKYGLVDKAADQFEAVVARFPDNVDARTELREVYREKGQLDRAAEQALALAEISRLRGDAKAAAAHEAEARQLAPGLATGSAPAGAFEAPVEVEEEVAFGEESAEPAEVAFAAEEAEISFAAGEDAPPPSEEEEVPVSLGEPAGEGEAEFDLSADEEPPAGSSGLVPEAAFAPEPAFEAPTAEEEGETFTVPTEPEPGAEEEFDLTADVASLPEPEPPAPSPEAEEEFDLTPEDGEAEDFDLGSTPTDLGRGGPEAEEPELALPPEEPELALPPGEPAESELVLPPEEPPAAAEPPDLGLDLDEGPAPPDAGLPELDEEIDLGPAEEPDLGLRPPPPSEVELDLEEPAFEEAPPPQLRVVPTAPRPAPAPAAIPPELQKVLDEADSFVAVGFVDDAKEALREIGTRYPGHPAILDKIGELGLDQEAIEEAPAPVAPPEDLLGELDLGAPPVPEPEAPPPPPAEEAPVAELSPESLLDAPSEAAPDAADMDLSSELGGLFAPQAAVEEAPPAAAETEFGDSSLADIFKEFKKGVDKQLGKEDYDTRYNLGIAYKEMGLVDEAIAEFQLAAKDEGRLLECSSMLGICFMEKGMPKLAVKWFEKGLKTPGRTEEEYNGLRYDLAGAFEAAGETDRALSLFEELYGQDANFRDVAAKVRELRSAQG